MAVVNSKLYLYIYIPCRWKALLMNTGGEKCSHAGRAFDPFDLGFVLFTGFCMLNFMGYGLYQREEKILYLAPYQLGEEANGGELPIAGTSRK